MIPENMTLADLQSLTAKLALVETEARAIEESFGPGLEISLCAPLRLSVPVLPAAAPASGTTAARPLVFTASIVQEVLALRRAGLSSGEISHRVGIGYTNVCHILADAAEQEAAARLGAAKDDEAVEVVQFGDGGEGGLITAPARDEPGPNIAPLAAPLPEWLGQAGLPEVTVSDMSAMLREAFHVPASQIERLADAGKGISTAVREAADGAAAMGRRVGGPMPAAASDVALPMAKPATAPKMPPWSEEEDRRLIKIISGGFTAGFTRKACYETAVKRLGRSFSAVETRAKGPLSERVEQALKDAAHEVFDAMEAGEVKEADAAAPDLQATLASPAVDREAYRLIPERVGSAAVEGTDLEAMFTALNEADAAKDAASALAVSVSASPAAEAAEMFSATAARAEAAHQPAAKVAAQTFAAEDVADDMGQHLASVPRQGVWTLQADAELFRLAGLRWQTHEIAAELGVKDADVLARFKVLTSGPGANYRRADVADRLEQMVARLGSAAA